MTHVSALRVRPVLFFHLLFGMEVPGELTGLVIHPRTHGLPSLYVVLHVAMSLSLSFPRMQTGRAAGNYRGTAGVIRKLRQIAT